MHLSSIQDETFGKELNTDNKTVFWSTVVTVLTKVSNEIVKLWCKLIKKSVNGKREGQTGDKFC